MRISNPKIKVRIHNTDSYFIYILERFDKKGVRAFIGYSETTGKYRVECFKRKSGSWKLERIFNPHSYYARRRAYKEAIKLAKRVLNEDKIK